MPLAPYYQDDWCTIYHGDCRIVLPQLRDSSSEFLFEVVVTDPPYGVAFAGKTAVQRDGSMRINRDGYGFDDTPEYVRTVVVPVLQPLMGHVRIAVTPGTRNLWCYPPADDVGCFYSAAGTGLGRWGFTCSQPILYYGKDPYLQRGSGARANSCGQLYPNDANASGHPCAKPLRMMLWLVERVSMPGETILDPFMGSGTTLQAAKDLGRRALGIEIEERYCEIAVKRLRQEVLPLTYATEAI